MKNPQRSLLPLGDAPASETLNEQQLAAVTHRSGPLLIVAGAGTGKTKTLTHRIAWLTQEKLAKPSEILALTFTDKAAAEMETRVDELLPYGQTDATISTFNAFGDQLLREHALDSGLPPEFQILGQVQQELFLSERFDEIEGLTQLRPTGSPRKFVAPILQVISRAKDELVSPERYAEVAHRLLRDASGEDEQREAARQVDIATIYAAYESMKAERGVIDFGDQILLLYRLLGDRPTLRRKLQQRFKFILVDEFQDTNVAQYQLVKQLLGENSNLTVVGDDDQAIYKFRGAAVSNILGFLKDFPSATQVILTQNYRSTQPILDCAYALIQHNNPDRLESKLAIDKHLVGEKGGEAPVVHWYQHEADELTALIEAIGKVTATRKDRHAELVLTSREVLSSSKTYPAHIPKRVRDDENGLRYSDIAVLVRSNSLIGSVAQALTKAGIPFVSSRDDAFVNLPEVRGIAAFLKVLVHSDDSLALLKLMLSPFYHFEAEWILPLSDAARRANRPLHDVLFDAESVAWQRVPKEGTEPLAQLRADLRRYRSMIGTKNPGEILYQFLKERGVLDSSSDGTRPVSHSPSDQVIHSASGTGRVNAEAERLAMIQNIAAVFEAISGYLAAGRDPFAFAFVDELPSLLATVTPPATTVGPDVDAVNVMTVHAAKGLEFETVFLPSLMADRFPARRRARALELPTELIAEQLPSGDEHLQEERRLMYVAMTRAKRRLLLSGAERVGSGTRARKISQFITEALVLPEVPTPIITPQTNPHLDAFTPSVPVPPTIAYPQTSDVLFLSPAAIETYLADPYNFYWKYVLKAPQAPSRHLVYGNAIHSAIEAYYHELRSLSSEVEERSGISSEVSDRLLTKSTTSEETRLSTSEESNRKESSQLLNAALRRYAEAWKGEGFESKADENRQFEHGRETIERFVERAASEPLPELVEHSFTLGLPGVKIKGRIDALFTSASEIRDFKTSKVATQKEADKKLRDNLPIRIYALAFRQQFGRLPSALVLDFVEHDLKASLAPTQELLSETKVLIAQAVEGIKAGKFDPNPDNPFKDYE